MELKEVDFEWNAGEVITLERSQHFGMKPALFYKHPLAANPTKSTSGTV
jgi:hypothetical protein